MAPICAWLGCWAVAGPATRSSAAMADNQQFLRLIFAPHHREQPVLMDQFSPNKLRSSTWSGGQMSPQGFRPLQLSAAIVRATRSRTAVMPAHFRSLRRNEDCVIVAVSRCADCCVAASDPTGEEIACPQRKIPGWRSPIGDQWPLYPGTLFTMGPCSPWGLVHHGALFTMGPCSASAGPAPDARRRLPAPPTLSRSQFGQQR
jgi:hypothetical protein